MTRSWLSAVTKSVERSQRDPVAPYVETFTSRASLGITPTGVQKLQPETQQGHGAYDT